MANLTSERERPPALAFVSGEGSQSVAEVVATLRADKAARQAKAERAERVKQLLAAEGLEGYRGRVPSVAAFENSGVGSAEAAVAETRAQRDREKGSVARSAAICARLEAEGLQGQHHDAAVTAYICSGEGSEEAAVAAARGAAAAAAAAADAVVARRTRVNELLAAEDLEGCASRYGAPAVHDFIRTGEGTAEAAVAAVRAVAERCTAIAACLQSEGLQQYNHVAAVQQYVRGDGSEEAALAAARAAAERVQQVQARRASITGSLALMAAEGETFHELCWRVPGLEAFVYDGAGSEAETLAAVSRVLRAEADQRKRRERVGERCTGVLVALHHGADVQVSCCASSLLTRSCCWWSSHTQRCPAKKAPLHASLSARPRPAAPCRCGAGGGRPAGLCHQPLGDGSDFGQGVCCLLPAGL